MYRPLKHLILGATLLCALVSCRQQETLIHIPTPPRPASQQHVLRLTAPAIDTVRIGFIGIGGRGDFAVYRYQSVPWTKISALCDIVREKCEKTSERLVSLGFRAPDIYDGPEGYKELCQRDDIDLIYICTDWESHTPLALYAMEHGKHVAIEVPAATTLDECWALVNTAERTRRHCMMLENCCYDFFELNSLEMARRGMLGEIVHAEGSYLHTLYPIGRDWRHAYNYEHKGDVYPTHGLGPVAQALNIHRGDRFKTLMAMESEPIRGIRATETMQRRDSTFMQGKDPKNFQNGDVTCTLIKTENGKSILIEHDVMTPRPYNRMYQLVGTDGYAAKYPVEQVMLPREEVEAAGAQWHDWYAHSPLSGEDLAKIRENCQNPILTTGIEELAKKVGGHGGMDFLMDYRLIYCLHYGLPLDEDVYDAAEWCCLGELTAISIANGGAPVDVPDFTRGAWKELDGFKYAFEDGSFR